jgi:hypothetical protein
MSETILRIDQHTLISRRLRKNRRNPATGPTQICFLQIAILPTHGPRSCGRPVGPTEEKGADMEP